MFRMQGAVHTYNNKKFCICSPINNNPDTHMKVYQEISKSKSLTQIVSEQICHRLFKHLNFKTIYRKIQKLSGVPPQITQISIRATFSP